MERLEDAKKAQLIAHFSEMQVTIASSVKAWNLFDETYQGVMAKDEYLKMQAEQASCHFKKCGCGIVKLGGHFSGVVVSELGKCDCHGSVIYLCLDTEVQEHSFQHCQRVAIELTLYHFEQFDLCEVHSGWHLPGTSSRVLH